MTKIDLITGILGSGKTTFLMGYARHMINNGERIAILENDFGAVNVDMLMLKALKGDNCQLEMVSGGGDHDCHKRRFKTQLIALGMQHFDRVIIEPSGIFDMDEFFDIIHESPLDSWFETGSIITIADACMEDELSEQMEYLLASEAACCGKLLLSKTEQLKGETVSQAAERVISHLNKALSEIKCDRRFTEKDVLADGLKELTDADYE
ncbi:MAG: GTPase (G3E family), partial [Ruminococcus sp.]|nr:GTPase (G3E family) [Ruminococcus sp.]